MPNEVHIVVACGGSGIKTLIRLNQLLCQDDYWRRRVDNDVYYVVVDTDVDEINEFHAAVARDRAGALDPLHITAISLAQGEANLQPLINRYLVEPFRSDTAGRDRVLAHWWSRDGEPFSAPRVIGLTKGAGQCPPISYFLAWTRLKDLEDRFDDLIKAIQRRQGGFGRLDVLNFVIVSSLAGGTGRGCWEVVAFKLREMFRRYTKVPNPRAFLFDASVFGNVYKDEPKQRVPMQVNSLTGVSQLSCWIENQRLAQESGQKKAYRYWLPSLASPAEPSADVLHADLYNDINEGSPVNHAYLIFDSNGVASLENNQQYYEMVGAALYAALSKSSITRREINSNEPYVGLATGTFEVDAATLRRYFEAQAHVQATRMLVQPDPRAVEAKVAEFFKTTQLEVNVTAQDPGTFFRADPQGLFLQKVLARLEARSRDRIAALERALADDDVEETRRMAKSVLSVQEDIVRACFDDVLQETGLDPLFHAASLARDLFEKTHSVVNVQMFIQQVQAALEVELQEMPGEMPLGRDDPCKLAEEYAGRPFPLGFRHYNEAECTRILEVARRSVPRANYVALKKVLADLYRGWARQMDRLRANAAGLAECFQKLQGKFAKERDLVVPGAESVFAELFTDPDQPEKALAPRFGAMKFYRRVLKPVMAPGGDLELIRPAVKLKKDLFDAAVQALEQERVSESEAFDAQRRLTARLERAVRDTVALPDDFIVENFSLRKVIDGLRRAWRNYLSKGMAGDVRATREEHFEEIFGFVPQRTDEGGELTYEFPDIDGFLFAMAASLARTCKPYWRLRGEDQRKTNVLLFVPTNVDKAAADSAVRGLLASKAPDILPDVYPQQRTSDPANPTTHNPFVLLAFSTCGTDQIEDIASLDYFNDGEVLRLMKAVEDPRGETIFSGGQNGGLGYVDPFYLDPQAVEGLKRWRPWAGGQAAAAEQRRTADAILYALFPGDDPREDLAEVQAELERTGWPMPLIQHTGGNRYALARLPLVIDRGEIRKDQAVQRLPGWDADRPLHPKAGLHNVWQALQGEGECPHADWRQRILEEAALFWKTVLPKINIAPGTPAYRNVLVQYQAWVSRKFREAKEDDASKKVWGELLGRITEMVEEGR